MISTRSSMRVKRIMYDSHRPAGAGPRRNAFSMYLYIMYGRNDGIRPEPIGLRPYKCELSDSARVVGVIHTFF